VRGQVAARRGRAKLQLLPLEPARGDDQGAPAVLGQHKLHQRQPAAHHHARGDAGVAQAQRRIAQRAPQRVALGHVGLGLRRQLRGLVEDQPRAAARAAADERRGGVGLRVVRRAHRALRRLQRVLRRHRVGQLLRLLPRAAVQRVDDQPRRLGVLLQRDEALQPHQRHPGAVAAEADGIRRRRQRPPRRGGGRRRRGSCVLVVVVLGLRLDLLGLGGGVLGGAVLGGGGGLVAQLLLQAHAPRLALLPALQILALLVLVHLLVRHHLRLRRQRRPPRKGDGDVEAAARAAGGPQQAAVREGGVAGAGAVVHPQLQGAAVLLQLAQQRRQRPARRHVEAAHAVRGVGVQLRRARQLLGRRARAPLGPGHGDLELGVVGGDGGAGALDVRQLGLGEGLVAGGAAALALQHLHAEGAVVLQQQLPGHALQQAVHALADVLGDLAEARGVGAGAGQQRGQLARQRAAKHLLAELVRGGRVAGRQAGVAGHHGGRQLAQGPRAPAPHAVNAQVHVGALGADRPGQGPCVAQRRRHLAHLRQLAAQLAVRLEPGVVEDVQVGLGLDRGAVAQVVGVVRHDDVLGLGGGGGGFGAR
jgi:hypothetical protein